jgi:predicted DNA-binding transcriptional regulator AlpA
MSKESVIFIRYQEAARLLGVSRFTLWRWSREGLFPKPIKLGPNTSGFLLNADSQELVCNGSLL